MEAINFEFGGIYIFLCILLGALYALVVYFRANYFGTDRPILKGLLAFLRGSAVSLIALLLLNPFIKSLVEEKKNPIVILAVDESESVTNSFTEEALKNYDEELLKLKENLSNEYDLEVLRFGGNVATTNEDTIEQRSTNISQLLKYVEDGYGDQNLGAVILSTDGIYNEGKNPIYDTGVKKAPIYSIALGDTTKRRDVWIEDIFHNQILYLGDKFSVQLDIKADNSTANRIDAKLYKIVGGKTIPVDTKSVNIQSNDFFSTETFELEANDVGVIQYRIALSVLKGEISTKNNVKDFFTEVIDGRQKVMLLAAAPHPDIAAFKTLLATNKNYETSVNYITSPSSEIYESDIVLFHNLPSSLHSITDIVERLNKKKTPRIYVTGATTSMNNLEALQNTVLAKSTSQNKNEIQATINSSFSLFKVSETLKDRISAYPPLTGIFGEYANGPKSYSLLSQKIGSVKTDYPLLSFSEEGGKRTAILAGEGIWRWRLFEFLDKGDDAGIKELINKTFQYVSVKQDRRPFRVSSNKKIYNENERVLFEGQLFNESYELINTPELELTLKNSQGKEFPFRFTRINDYYSLNAGTLPSGSYSFVANTNYNGKTFTDKGKINIKEIQLESYNLTADHTLLKTLSEKNNGSLVYPDQLNNLESLLTGQNKLKPVLYNSSRTSSVLNYWWLMGIILLLLLLEWFLRRYYGSY